MRNLNREFYLESQEENHRVPGAILSSHDTCEYHPIVVPG